VKATVLAGDVMEALLKIPEETVQCVVTSPPYWGLRDYKIPPSIWGGDPGCAHQWGMEHVEREMRLGKNLAASPASHAGGSIKCALTPAQSFDHGFCQRCGAWLGCLGLEPTPELYVAHVVQVFREVRRVLADAGTLWMNLGDSYATGTGSVGDCPGGGEQGARWAGDLDRLRDEKRGYRGDRLANGRKDQAAILRQKTRADRDGTHAGKHTGITAMGPMTQPNRMPLPGLKPKDLVGIPWMVAFALRADGWYLRQDIIWSKPNPMPESVTDRCTKAHEYLFLLAKSERYYFNAAAIAERSINAGKVVTLGEKSLSKGQANGANVAASGNGKLEQVTVTETRNKRSVWQIATQPYPEAHFATFPEALVEPCILAGSRPGDTVLDPFAGSGTTGVVALRYRRHFVGVELNLEYAQLAEKRIGDEAPMFNEVEVVG
jgi:DNA modification methylase